MGKDESGADAGALLGGDRDGGGGDASAASLGWTAAGPAGEEVADHERDTDALAARSVASKHRLRAASILPGMHL